MPLSQPSTKTTQPEKEDPMYSLPVHALEDGIFSKVELIDEDDVALAHGSHQRPIHPLKDRTCCRSRRCRLGHCSLQLLQRTFTNQRYFSSARGTPFSARLMNTQLYVASDQNASITPWSASLLGSSFICCCTACRACCAACEMSARAAGPAADGDAGGWSPYRASNGDCCILAIAASNRAIALLRSLRY